jgi:hypothetical protein
MQPVPDAQSADLIFSYSSMSLSFSPFKSLIPVQVNQMTKKKKGFSPKIQAWIDARKRYRLSHAHVQMARELGMNPKKLGKKNNHDQEPWKMPLRDFIGYLYFERFGKERPDIVVSIEENLRRHQAKNVREEQLELRFR